MAKKDEAVLTIATCDVGDDFLVDVEANGQMYDYWLYRKDRGIKVSYVMVPKSNISNPEDVVNNYDWDEEKKHYTNNYLV